MINVVHCGLSNGFYSSPSAHALGSVVLYGFLASVLADHFPTLSRGIYGVAIGIIIAIGFSRLDLGVHYQQGFRGSSILDDSDRYSHSRVG